MPDAGGEFVGDELLVARDAAGVGNVVYGLEAGRCSIRC